MDLVLDMFPDLDKATGGSCSTCAKKLCEVTSCFEYDHLQVSNRQGDEVACFTDKT